MNKIATILVLLICLVSNINAQNYNADIEQIWLEHNVYNGNEKGVKIHVKFTVNNMLNKSGNVVAYFYFDNGTALKDYNQKYRTIGGDVSVGDKYTPNYTNAIYNDFVLFLPYSELHLSDGNHDLKCQVNIFDNNSRSLVQSDFNDFNISWSQPQSTPSYPTINNPSVIYPTYTAPVQTSTGHFATMPCSVCHGTGKSSSTEYPPTFGLGRDIMKTSCPYCGDIYVHSHKICYNCRGTGNVQQWVQ
jgi:hypothetical protein